MSNNQRAGIIDLQTERALRSIDYTALQEQENTTVIALSQRVLNELGVMNPDTQSSEIRCDVSAYVEQTLRHDEATKAQTVEVLGSCGVAAEFYLYTEGVNPEAARKPDMYQGYERIRAHVQ